VTFVQLLASMSRAISVQGHAHNNRTHQIK